MTTATVPASSRTLSVSPLAISRAISETAAERGLLCWFGIRGIGSVYYLMFAINRGLNAEMAWQLTSITLTVIAVSIVVHGITVTPLMNWHHRRRQRRLAKG